MDAGFEALEEARGALDAERTVFNRRQQDLEHMLHEAEAGATSGKKEVNRLRVSLHDVRKQLRDAQDVAAGDRRAMKKRAGEADLARQAEAALREQVADLEADLSRVRQVSDRAMRQSRDREQQLKRDLNVAKAEAARGEELLEAERRKHRVLQVTLQKELKKGAGRGERGGGDDGFVDVSRRAQTAHGGRSGAVQVDVATTIRRNETLINDLSRRRGENARLRADNQTLLLHAKDANQGQHLLRAQITANVADRSALMKRLEKAKGDVKRLEKTANRYADDATQRRQADRAFGEQDRWARLDGITPSESAYFRSTHMARPPTRTRNIPVASWGASRD